LSPQTTARSGQHDRRAHPAHAPPVDLAILAACPVGVAEWDGGAPPDERRADAPLHHGICRRCSDELRAVEDDPEMRGVARFSAANHMDPLMGYPDDVAARRELDHYIDAASVVESMLVALHHMQVSVCYIRGRHSRSSGLSCFRKNIISFPQDLMELQQLHSFLSQLQANDVVNVEVPAARGSTGATAASMARARVVRPSPRGFVVEDAGGVVRDVPRSAVRQVLRLPFTLQDLRDKFVVFRRKDSVGDEYVEDLRVRRNLVRGLLLLLSKKGHWRPHHGEEPMHKYYVGFEWLSDEELEALLPEDGVPEDLHFETLQDEDAVDGLGADDFEEWLRWGRYDQPLAQALLHHWQADVSVCGNDSVQDFYRLLLDESRQTRRKAGDGAAAATAAAEPSADDEAPVGPFRVPRRWLAEYLLDRCDFSVPLGPATSRGDVVAAVEAALVEEISAVRVYLGHWRSSAAVFDYVAAADAAADTVENRLTQDLHDAAHPWPAIEVQPAEAWCDGRFVKAFPLEFPMCVADLHQERLRSDFSAAAWAQHLFRYFDGRFLRSSRGHRVIWAVFNTVLR